MAEKKMKEQSLFGPVDQAMNTLDTEITLVQAEIDRRIKTVQKKQEEIQQLGNRLEDLKGALVTVRKAQKKPAVKANPFQA